MYLGDHPTDVQDPGAERPDPSVQSERLVPGRHQVQWQSGHHAGSAAGRLFPLHI